MADKMFTARVEQDLPLASLLDDPARNALENASGVDRTMLGELSDEWLVGHYLNAWDQRFPPAVVGDVRPPQEPHRTERRSRDRDDPQDHLEVWRWRVEFRVLGQNETLTRWPASLRAEPCGDGNQFHPIPWVFWQREGNSVAAYFDVPYDEDPQGQALPRERILQATEYLHNAADAANAEVAERRAQIEAELRRLLADRRARLEVIEGQRSDLIELVRERFGTIEVKRIDDPVPPAAVDAAGGEIVLNHVISDGSFEQLIRVTRKWTVGAERYPDAFGPLEEEAITSLLVTTLNVAFDVAHREVYQGKGKTDIFVQANVGMDGEAAHIGEAKIWRGQKRVHTGNDGKPSDVEQLFGYANSRTRQLMLVYYVRQKAREQIEARAIEALAKAPGFDHWEEGADHAAAIFRHPEFGQEIHLTALFVHLPVDGAPDPDDENAP